MRTVLYIMNSSHFSGAEIVVKRLISANKSTKSIIICSEGTFYDSLKLEGFNVYCHKSLNSIEFKFLKPLFYPIIILYKSIQLALFCTKMLKENKALNFVEVVNTIAGLYSIVFIIFSKLVFRRKLVFIRSHFDSSFHNLTNLQGKVVWKLLNILFDITLVPSLYTKKVYNAVTSGNSKLLYSGQHSEQIIKKFNRQKNKKITIAIIGQIIKDKGHLYLINAMENIRYENYQLVIVGNSDTTFGRQLKLICQGKSTLKNKVTFSGFIQDIDLAYKNFNVIINASNNRFAEPLGTTIIEGMKKGKIVIASNVGGTSEIIDHGINGYLFESENVQDLTKNLQFVLENYNNLERVRINAILKIKKKFSIEEMIKNYNQILSNSYVQ